MSDTLHEETGSNAKQRESSRSTGEEGGQFYTARVATDAATNRYSSTMLGSRALGSEPNSALRSSVMQRAQQTHGNRSVQRFLASASAAVNGIAEDNLATRIERASGAGSKLDGAARETLEEGLGTDLSGVRVHTDVEADRLARSVSASAFTSGQDIFFREGVYNPHSGEGLRLLAHEVTHTVQQAAGPVAGTDAPGGISVSDPSDSFEQAAEAAADRIADGEPAHDGPVGGSFAATASLASGQSSAAPVQRGGVMAATGRAMEMGGGGLSGLGEEILKGAGGGGGFGGIGGALGGITSTVGSVAGKVGSAVGGMVGGGGGFNPLGPIGTLIGPGTPIGPGGRIGDILGGKGGGFNPLGPIGIGLGEGGLGDPGFNPFGGLGGGGGLGDPGFSPFGGMGGGGFDPAFDPGFNPLGGGRSPFLEDIEAM